jgi:hypothetical protein
VVFKVALYECFYVAVWAGYEENAREGVKYKVAKRPQRTGPRDQCPRVRAVPWFIEKSNLKTFDFMILTTYVV